MSMLKRHNFVEILEFQTDFRKETEISIEQKCDERMME